MKRKAWFQFTTLCLSIYVSGWNDGALGPMLPRLQAVYDVGYAVVSLIFIISCLGSIVGSCTFMYLTDRFGFGKVVVGASVSLMAAYALEAAAVPFPAFVFAYFFNGFGTAFLNAGSNAFLASRSAGKASSKMGFMHAIYGMGAMCAPLIATQFANIPRWSFVFLTHLGITVVNTILQIAVFRFKTQEECFLEIGQPRLEKKAEGWLARYKKVFRIPAVHLMALFAFIYVGHEVTVGSWIVTYIIKNRQGGPSSGYISSGFFGGLMLGRVSLLWFNKLIGERRVVYVYILAVVALELVIWFAPNLLAGAISVSFVGFFLGPMYPILMNHAGRILPHELMSGAIGWTASWGAAGAAIFPFITGAIASKAGIGSLQPVLITLMAILFIVWACVPNSRMQ
ncbi:MFS general substrate transporter [Fomes fomentarius]|nr:MFS general substrate transporter [Fomes fomentarius]